MQLPVISIYLIASCLLESFFEPLEKLLRIPDSLAMLAVNCAVVYNVWDDLHKGEKSSVMEGTNRFISVWGNSILYGLAILVGGLLLVLPGLYMSVVASLGIVFICVEKMTAMKAFSASHDLVKGHFWKAASYLVPTPLILFAVAFGGLVLISIMLEIATPNFEMGLPWKVITSFWTLFCVWGACSITSLQVRLYAYLKSIQPPG